MFVRFRRGTPAAEARATLQGVALGDGRPIAHTGFELVLTDGRDPAALARSLRRDRNVADVELNFVRHATALPNDPIFLKSVREKYLDTLRLPQAWDLEKGSAAVKIAILDTGVNAELPDLAGRVLTGYNFVDGSTDTRDLDGHGSFVAGIAAANTSNRVGMAGVAWRVSILPVKVLDDSGSGTDAEIASGITWAADNGASVINLSLGDAEQSEVLQSAIDYARSKDVVVVASAGNEGREQPQYPAAAAGVVAVAATDWGGELTNFSSYGPWVDLVAPGFEVTGPSTTGYDTASGTSFSAPLVSGIAALVRAHNPGWTGEQIVADLERTARDLGSPGVDDEYGYGMVDAYGALGGPPAPRPAVGSDAAEPNDVPDRATLIPKTSLSTFMVTGSLSSEGDVDWYAWQVNTAGQIVWTVRPGDWYGRVNEPPAELMEPELKAYGPDLRFLGLAEVGQTLTIPVQQAGTYYLKVWNRNGSRSVGYDSNGNGTYRYQVFAQFNGPLGTGVPWLGPADGYYFDDDPHPGDPETVAVGDVTGDGRNDLLVTTGSYFSRWDDSLVLYRQQADGFLAQPVKLPQNQAPGQVAVADLNGDGKKDVIVAGTQGIDVYLQNSDALAPSYRIANTAPAGSLTPTDVDSDGRTDLVVLVAGNLVILHNTGSGFTQQTLDNTLQRSCSNNCVYAVVGDLNGDGRMDIVESGYASTSNGYAAVLRTWLQAPGSTFTSTESTFAGNLLGSLAIGDLNGDGRDDVVTTINGGATYLDLFPGTASALGAPTQLAHPSGGPIGYAIADINRDGRSDLVFSQGMAYPPSPLTYFLQTASGTLRQVNGSNGNIGSGFEVGSGDLNGDGLIDLVSTIGDRTDVLRSYNPAWPREPLAIRSTTPAQDSVGIASDTPITFRFARTLDAGSVNGSTMRLTDSSGAAVPGTVSYDQASGDVTLTPSAPLAAGTYRATLSGVIDSTGDTVSDYRLRFQVGAIADTTAPNTYITTAVRAYLPSYPPWQPTFELAASKPVQRFECSDDGGAWFTCISPVAGGDWVGGDYRTGSHHFSVRAVDDAGNVDPTPATTSWTITSSTPTNTDFASAATLTGGSGTASGTNIGSISRFPPTPTGNVGGASVWYRWTAPTSAPVEFDTGSSSFDTLLAVYTGTSSGSLTLVADNDDAWAATTSSRVGFQATAGTTYTIVIDGFNAWDGAPAEGTFTLRWGADSPPPDTTITSAPPAFTSSSDANFSFTSSDPNARFQCSLDSAAPSVCSAPISYSSLQPGAHTFEVAAVSGGDNVDPTVATYTWTVQAPTPPPDTTITAGPAATSTATDASFSFVSSAPNSTFKCSLDGAAFTTCSSPVSYTDLALGQHSFHVYAIDASGTADPTPADYTWTIEAPVPPDTTITSAPPASTTEADATFSFSASPPTATFKCSLDDAAYAACSSPITYARLSAGSHTFRVEAIAPSGDADPTPASFTWTIVPPVLPPPETTITAAPPATTTASDATFSFISSAPNSAFKCSLDTSPYTTCTSPVSYTGLAAGTHTFAVEAIDGTGNTDPTPATATWTIQPTTTPASSPPPDTMITSAPARSTTATDATFSFASSTPNSTFQCSLDSAGFTACESPTTYAKLTHDAHTFQVLATDANGATDPTPAEYDWTITTPATGVHGAASKITVHIKGAAIVGQTLRAILHPTTKVRSYRWSACTVRCKAIRGATHASLHVRRAWLTQRLRITVTAPDGAKASATSTPVHTRRRRVRPTH